MSFITERFLAFIDSALGNAAAQELEKLRFQQLKERLHNDLSVLFIKKYGNCLFFNDLDAFLCSNNFVEFLFKKCHVAEFETGETAEQYLLLMHERFVKTHPRYANEQSAVKACLQELFKLVFNAFNDSTYSEETRIILNYLTNYHMDDRRLLQNIDTKVTSIEKTITSCSVKTVEADTPEFVITRASDITATPDFIGREQELNLLRRWVREQKGHILISGMGGIGKTHLCRYLYNEYMKLHKNGSPASVEHIGYLMYNESMDNTVYEGIKYHRTNDHDTDIMLAWSALTAISNNSRFLLFIDGVSNQISNDPSLKKLYSLPGTIIMTSRFSGFAHYEALNLDSMDYRDCQILFECIYGRVSDEEQSILQYILCELAGRHTLTIELLAHIAKNKCLSIGELEDKLKTNRFKIKYRSEEMLTSLQEEYEKLFRMSELSDSEKNVLEAFSLFPYTPLDIKICCNWLNEDALVSEDEEIFSLLSKKGWLKREGSLFSLHQVIAAVILEKQKACVNRHIGLIRSCISSIDIDKVKLLSGVSFFIPFAEKIAAFFCGQADFDVEYHNSLYYNIGRYYYLSGNYLRAKQYLESAFQLTKELPGLWNFKNCALLAKLYESLGDNEKAMQYIEFSRLSWVLLKEEDLFWFKDLLQTSAFIDKNLGKYEPARDKINDILTWSGNVCDDAEEVSRQEATAYCCLGNICKSEGDYPLAFEYYEKALNLAMALSNREDFLVSDIYGCLVSVNIISGDIKVAGIYCDKKLAYLKSIINDEKHIKFAYCYDSKGCVLCELGRYDEAIEQFELVLQILDNDIYRSHELYNRVFNHYGFTAYRKGDYDLAAAQFERILKQPDSEGDKALKNVQNEYDAAAAMYGMGLIYEKQQVFPACVFYYHKAKELCSALNFDDARELYITAAQSLYNLKQ